MSAIRRALNKVSIKVLRRLLRHETLAPNDVQHQEITRILVICRQPGVEEMLLATPTFRAMRQSFPDAHLAVVADENSVDVLQSNKYVDEVFGFPSGFSQGFSQKLHHFFLKMRQRFDLAIVLNTGEHSLISDLIARMSRAKYRLGPKKPVPDGEEENWFYNLRAPASDVRNHLTERFLRILKYIDIETDSFSEHLNLTMEEKGHALAFLQEHDVDPGEMIVAFHFESCEEAESFPVSRAVYIAKYFSTKFNAKILASCSHQDEACLRKFGSGLPFVPIEVIGFDARASAAILFCCDFVICYDSEVMHLAAAVGVPTISLYGRRDPHTTKPIGRPFIALKGASGSRATITPEQVIDTAETMLANFPKQRRFESGDFDISEKAVEEILNHVVAVNDDKS